MTSVSRALPKLAPFREKATDAASGGAAASEPLPRVNTTAVSCAKLAFDWPVAGDSVTSNDVFVGTCAPTEVLPQIETKKLLANATM